MCPYIDQEGYYCEWDNEYYSTHQECIEASTVMVYGNIPMVMEKTDFYMVSGTFGALMSVLIVWAVLKAIL